MKPETILDQALPRRGNFRFQAGFRPLPHHSTLFVQDENAIMYKNEKIACHDENISKYYCVSKGFTAADRHHLAHWLLTQLQREQPDRIQKNGNQICYTSPTETFCLEQRDTQYEIINAARHYENALDAIISNLQEDLCLVSLQAETQDQNQFLHVCLPNHWPPANMLDRNFIQTHAAVPEMAHINQRRDILMQSILKKPPLIRYAWGLATDRRLNHHPLAPVGTDADAWHGRDFSREQPELYLRVERQLLMPLLEDRYMLFLIRTWLFDVDKLETPMLQRLLNSLESMSTEIAIYKGLEQSRAAIIDWLHYLIHQHPTGHHPT